jgi:hypothetical protein
MNPEPCSTTLMPPLGLQAGVIQLGHHCVILVVFIAYYYKILNMNLITESIVIFLSPKLLPHVVMGACDTSFRTSKTSIVISQTHFHSKASLLFGNHHVRISHYF